MLSKNEANELVVKGVEFLDTHEPGWYKDINMEKLDLSNCHNCVLGQVGIARHEEALGQHSGLWNGFDYYLRMFAIEPKDRGFDLPKKVYDDDDVSDWRESWLMLEDAWADAIKEKFEKDTL